MALLVALYCFYSFSFYKVLMDRTRYAQYCYCLSSCSKCCANGCDDASFHLWWRYEPISSSTGYLPSGSTLCVLSLVWHKRSGDDCGCIAPGTLNSIAKLLRVLFVILRF